MIHIKVYIRTDALYYVYKIFCLAHIYWDLIPLLDSIDTDIITRTSNTLDVMIAMNTDYPEVDLM